MAVRNATAAPASRWLSTLLTPRPGYQRLLAAPPVNKPRQPLAVRLATAILQSFVARDLLPAYTTTHHFRTLRQELSQPAIMLTSAASATSLQVLLTFNSGQLALRPVKLIVVSLDILSHRGPAPTFIQVIPTADAYVHLEVFSSTSARSPESWIMFLEQIEDQAPETCRKQAIP